MSSALQSVPQSSRETAAPAAAASTSEADQNPRASRCLCGKIASWFQRAPQTPDQVRQAPVQARDPDRKRCWTAVAVVLAVLVGRMYSIATQSSDEWCKAQHGPALKMCCSTNGACFKAGKLLTFDEVYRLSNPPETIGTTWNGNREAYNAAYQRALESGQG